MGAYNASGFIQKQLTEQTDIAQPDISELESWNAIFHISLQTRCIASKQRFSYPASNGLLRLSIYLLTYGCNSYVLLFVFRQKNCRRIEDNYRKIATNM